ncbi:VOC family protein [Caballeronia telluris]|uniref:Glyoxalase/Bleomycin resistance protein/Dioxygenase superfamily protein n=1 Tax=Caballeronia telluris TaxID=326475 RepID=A0A158KBP0_9BURK|nr:VOC family protein [Caballeronia telluris]SAL78504.1 Glyoxalase/Bleomycin resistance protein/Dioxygenase superfamily protein [Caballeronia telluris]
MNAGFAHVGVSTHDMETTVAFYCHVLGCRLVGDERIEIGKGGVIRQVSIDVGEGQYFVFMEAKGVDGIRGDYDTSINRSLGVPLGMYHYALRVASMSELTARAEAIARHGIDVSEVTDLGNAKAVFLQDPNGLQLELSVKIRDFDESDIGRITKAEVADSA